MTEEILKLRIPETSGVLIDLYNVEGYVNVVYVEIGDYFHIEKYDDSNLEPEDSYNTFSRQNSLAFFRIWLENVGRVSKEEMVSLLKYGNYNIAGLVLLSWMREVPDFNLDPTISWVKLSSEDWGTVLTILTCNEYVGA